MWRLERLEMPVRYHIPCCAVSHVTRMNESFDTTFLLAHSLSDLNGETDEWDIGGDER